MRSLGSVVNICDAWHHAKTLSPPVHPCLHFSRGQDHHSNTLAKIIQKLSPASSPIPGTRSIFKRTFSVLYLIWVIVCFSELMVQGWNHKFDRPSKWIRFAKHAFLSPFFIFETGVLLLEINCTLVIAWSFIIGNYWIANGCVATQAIIWPGCSLSAGGIFKIRCSRLQKWHFDSSWNNFSWNWQKLRLDTIGCWMYWMC